MNENEILSARPRIPEHVVERSFGDESVALNLQSAQYHGLNGVAARMFEQLRGAASVGQVVDPLAAEFEQPREVIERDLAVFVRGLEERGLVEIARGENG
jgi:Coenzyme PQQ synthesis protein D (PqqD)